MSGVLPPLPSIPTDVVAVSDYEGLARERMSASAWAYLEGGSADELTLADNLAAFRRVRLAGRVLADLAAGHTRLELFGDDFAHPILLAPVALHKLAHEHGEIASALGASAMRAGMVVSTEASVPLEAIADVARTPQWFQLYIQADRDYTLSLVRRAEAAGYRALVVTVDAPVSGVRNREQRAGFVAPAGIDAVNLRGMQQPPVHVARAGENAFFGSPLPAAAPTWNDIAWLAASTRLPIVLKGILAPADAERALAHGAAGIVVSNHGGRTLDTLPATIDALPPVARAVRGRAPILLDGGIRRGSDVLKALELGADAVMIGRAYLHGLAAAGAPGVAHVLQILHAELEVAMALTGCRTLADIDEGVIWRAGG